MGMAGSSSLLTSSGALSSPNPSAVMITDLEYPYRPAFSLLTKLLDEHAALLAQLPAPSAAPSFGSASANAFGGNPSQAAAGGLPPAQKGKVEGTLASYLTKYQDPKQADTIMKVQKELDETKIVLVSGNVSGAYRIMSLMSVAAQDDRVGAGAWREAGQPCRAIQRTVVTEQNVLQDGKKGETFGPDYLESPDTNNL